MKLIDASVLVIVAIFLITYWILRVFLFKPLVAVLEERKTTIRSAQDGYDSAIADAEKRIATERERLAATRLEANQLRDGVRKTAETERTRILEETKAANDQDLSAAQQRLEAEVTTEAATLQDKARDLASRVVDTLLRVSA